MGHKSSEGNGKGKGGGGGGGGGGVAKNWGEYREVCLL